MAQTKLTIRIPQDLLEGAKRYASQNQTTLTRLVSEYLRQLAGQSDPLQDAPVVRRLSGILSKSVSEADYRQHLEDKYGRKT
jgi:replication fork clamp-binding protein CrfC